MSFAVAIEAVAPAGAGISPSIKAERKREAAIKPAKSISHGPGGGERAGEEQSRRSTEPAS